MKLLKGSKQDNLKIKHNTFVIFDLFSKTNQTLTCDYFWFITNDLHWYWCKHTSRFSTRHSQWHTDYTKRKKLAYHNLYISSTYIDLLLNLQEPLKIYFKK